MDAPRRTVLRRWKRRRTAWSASAFLIVAGLLLSFFYPVWKILIGGKITLLEWPGFTRLWKADFGHTVTSFVGIEVGAAIAVGLLACLLYEEIFPRP